MDTKENTMSATHDKAFQGAAPLMYSVAGASAAEANGGAAAAVVPVSSATTAEVARNLQATNLATNDPKQIDEILRKTLLEIIREELATEIDSLGRLFGSSMYSVECYLTKGAFSMSFAHPSILIENAKLNKAIHAISSELGTQYRKLTDRSSLQALESFRKRYIAFHEKIIHNVNGSDDLEFYRETVLDVNTQDYQDLKDKMLLKTNARVIYG